MKKLIWLSIILLIVFFLAKVSWDNQFASVSSDESRKVFVIDKGIGVSDIAKKLQKEKLIKSELAFKIYVKQNNLTDKLQAGSYKLSPSMSLPELIKNLQTGSEDTWVTLIEGWRVEEMAEELSSKFKVQSSKFMKVAKEGYMFPDTYLFANNVTEEQIAKKLRDNFDTKYSDDLRTKIKALGLTEAQGVILASIVEREARSDEARKMVASILLKRFKIGMGLNADATLQYILGFQNMEKSWWKRHLAREDKKIDSPYNTYLYVGLPPAPICNPSLSALNAVGSADSSTPYLYYYHDSKGVPHYGRTLDEHNQNIANNP